MSTRRAPRPLQASLATLVALALCAPLAAQEDGGGSCRFVEGTSNLHSITLAGGARITYLSTPHIACDDGVYIEADSAVAYSAQNMSHLMGNVRYRDRTRELESDEARYFSRQGRLQANGNVFLEDNENGSVIRNGDLVYLRQTSFREREQLTVTTGGDMVRPRATLYMRPAEDTVAVLDTATVTDTAAVSDSAAAPDTLTPPEPTAAPEPVDTTQTPYEVEGDRLFLEGDGFFRATGRVVIDRDSLHATADSAEYDRVAGNLLLQGNARVDGATYDLEGRTITVAVPGGEVRDVRAVRDAVLVGDQLRLTSPVIHTFLVEGLLDRLVATPFRGELAEGEEPDSALLARPVAVAEEFVLTADSIDALAPGQVLDRIYAVGSAHGETSSRDTLNVEVLPEIARRDWIEGDTVIATFVEAAPDTLAAGPAAEADTAQAEYVLDQLIASGSAKSLYRLIPSDSTVRPGVDPPAVHYVTGSRILIVLNEGEVDRMEVDGPTRGYHLEPMKAVPDSLADSTAVADSALADTSRVANPVRHPSPHLPPAADEPSGPPAASRGWTATRRRGARR